MYKNDGNKIKLKNKPEKGKNTDLKSSEHI